jgi:hypothetical protein
MISKIFAQYEAQLNQDDAADARTLLDQIKQATFNKLRLSDPSKVRVFILFIITNM